MTSPVFVARFSDGVVTRMTIFPEFAALDLGRGIRLALIAYSSRIQQEPPPLTAARFENAKGFVLAKYDADALGDKALYTRPAKWRSS